MAPIQSLTNHVASGAPLSEEQTRAAVAALTDPEETSENKAEFLTKLAEKGETIEEITAFAKALRTLSIPAPLPPSLADRHVIDMCGTGGDRLNTFNISTAAAIVVAAAGVPVAKHGNRAITSRSGSADVLEALGIPVALSPEEASETLANENFAFFFAIHYHPAFKHIGPARKLCAEKGQRTLFNFLGPLLNPARPDCQLLGIARPALCESLAQTLKALGTSRAMVVCGAVHGAHMDELSIHGPNQIAEFYHDRAVSTSTLDPADFGFRASRLEDLAGGDAADNARIIADILSGNDDGPRADIVRLNAGAALFVAEAAGSITEGCEAARAVIASGQAAKTLERLRR